ncbi:MAG TPA: guanylate kinase [Chitinophagaceae bacterium]|nr:guanylate kinase [Chitinophagaceae bacterium]
MQDRKIIIITAPSGAGKTSITHYLLKSIPALGFSVSAATRKPRADEKDKEDYYFISEEEFRKKIQRNEFVEWEMVYEGKYYGTLKSELARIWKMDKIPLLDIDVKGAIHIEQQYPQNSLTIFVEPPSLNELKNRLLSRGTETDESLQARINKASYELSFKHSFDRHIVNDQFDRACKEAAGIVTEFINRDI